MGVLGPIINGMQKFKTNAKLLESILHGLNNIFEQGTKFGQGVNLVTTKFHEIDGTKILEDL